jgi:hypothetical protein
MFSTSKSSKSTHFHIKHENIEKSGLKTSVENTNNYLKKKFCSNA